MESSMLGLSRPIPWLFSLCHKLSIVRNCELAWGFNGLIAVIVGNIPQIDLGAQEHCRGRDDHH